MVKIAEVDVELTEQNSDSGGNGRLKVFVADENNQFITETDVTVEILADGGTYSATGQVGDTLGAATFNDVPIADYAITIMADGYETLNTSVSASDFK